MGITNFILRTSLITGLVLSSGCVSLSSPSPIDQISVVQINTQLEIPSGKARVYIQNDVQPNKKDIDKWSTFCSVLMQKLHSKGDPPVTVLAGRFDIIKLRKTSEFYADSYLNQTQKFDENIYKVDMRLKSDAQPDVRSLICAKHFAGIGSEYPTLEEIRTALGNSIKVETP